MSLLLALATIDVNTFDPFAVAPRKPANGDPAWTKYRGHVYHGVLDNLAESGLGKPIGIIATTHVVIDGISYPSQHNLYVGYDEAISWDDSVSMWHAPADWD